MSNKKDLCDALEIILMRNDISGRERIIQEFELCLSSYNLEKVSNEMVLYNQSDNEAIIQKFIVTKMVSGRTERTIDYYMKILRRWSKFLNDKPFTTVMPDDIRLVLARRSIQDGLTNTSINNELRVLSSLCTWMHNEGMIQANPISRVDVIKEKKKKKEAFSDLDLERIRLACKDERQKALIEVFLSTGCRVSELSHIRIADIEGNKIKVLGKGNKERYVYLNAKAQVAIEAYLKKRNDKNPYLFAASHFSGQPAKECLKAKHTLRSDWWRSEKLVSATDPFDKCSIENTIRSIGKRAGVSNCHPHRFRRTCATLALRSGMPLTHVSKMLGHESLDTTQIYLDINEREIEHSHSLYARG